MDRGRLYEFGKFRLDPLARRLLRDGQIVTLTPKVIDLLLVLVENRGRTVTKEELLKALWPNTHVEEGNLTQNISVLRKALAADAAEGEYIVTVPRDGYRFMASVAEIGSEEISEKNLDLARSRGSDDHAGSASHRAGWIIVAASAAAIGITAYALWPRPPELKPLVRLDIELDPRPASTPATNVIISPDGTRLVWIAQGRLFTQRLDQSEASEIRGTDGAAGPFFSPDGQWLAFAQAGAFKKISIDGGSPVALGAVTTNNMTAGFWGVNSSILVNPIGIGPIFRVPAIGGKPEKVSELDTVREEASHYSPQMLPDGRNVLFAAGGITRANMHIVAMSMADGKRKIVVERGSFPRYFITPDGTGYLAYFIGGTLFAAPFDANRLELRGTPAPVLENIVSNVGSAGSIAQFDASRNGTAVYVRGAAGLVRLVWMDSSGKIEPLLPQPGSYLRPKFSPDGNRVAVESPGDSGDIWVYEWGRGTMTRLTTTGGQGPIWTPDARYILYRGSGGIYYTRSDGAGMPRLLVPSKTSMFPYPFSPDGKRLVAQELDGSGWHPFTVSIESDERELRAGAPEFFLKTAGVDERTPTLSPDGRWMAYCSNESGTYQIYVRSFPDRSGKWQVSVDGGSHPLWSPDGRSLFFRSLKNQLMVAQYTAKGSSFSPQRPRLWAETRLADVSLSFNYDLHPDGRRIVAVVPAESEVGAETKTHVTILFNFLDELRRRIPR
ncbi:MAG TPA: winged helix-turn-helix domain-containing protein [Bryobacteraceae bacterium]|nr:winged helix-turn-helix domain-containing protein [Bryobacteraceae bacterium]